MWLRSAACCGGKQIGARAESQVVEILRLGQRGQHGILSTHVERRVGIAPEQRIKPGPRQIGVLIEPDHVFRQLRQRNLRLQNVLLRHLSGGVLDARLFNGLARNGHMLIVNPHFVVSEQQVIEGLVHAYPHFQADLFQFGLRLIHAGLGNAGAQRRAFRGRETSG